MAGRGNCRRTAAACTSAAQVREAEEREERQTMQMCRHVNPLPVAGRCFGTERQLCVLQQLMCEQNRLLSELLQAVRERNG